jgi:hypothetical protein
LRCSRPPTCLTKKKGNTSPPVFNGRAIFLIGARSNILWILVQWTPLKVCCDPSPVVLFDLLLHIIFRLDDDTWLL